jgi:hypothetical protein
VEKFSFYIPVTIVSKSEAFYGYYHMIVLANCEGYNMLSINGYSGQGGYHNWHGTFIQGL